MNRLLLLFAAGLGLTVVPGAAHATYCEGSPRIIGLPGFGAKEVPPGSSLFVSWHLDPVLHINGKVVQAGAFELLGPGDLGSWWRVRTELLPGASYAVTLQVNGGIGVTSFTTGMPSDATPGTPVEATRLRLWRVRFPQYPTGNSFDCIGGEHEGYIDVEYGPGTVPGTPDDEVVSVF